MRKIGFLFRLLSILMLSSCAIQVPPDGGTKDVLPPKLLSSDPENFVTDFAGKNIRLDFDEFVNLNDITNQLIVSPLLKYPVETKIRKKSLFLHIQDTLLENTTYTLNFGNGIVDNNEGNKLENFQFVFSTGPIIDSLSIRGRIVNAFDNKPEKGMLALLYNKSGDSLPYLERPLYFARADDNGGYRINNISPGAYKIIGLKDSDGNYLYVQNEDLIGFSDSLVKANSENVNLKVFRENPKLKFIKGYSEYAGKAVLVFSLNADTVKWQWLSDTTSLQLYGIERSKDGDSISIYYKNISSDSLSLRFDNKTLNDTVTMRLFKLSNESAAGGRKHSKMEITAAPQQTTVQHLYLPYYLISTRPLAKADFKKIVFTEDSIPINPSYTFTDSIHTQISISHKWKNKGKYSVFIPPQTFTDIYGVWNDTVRFEFTAHTETDYGSLKVKFQKKEDSPYVIQLVDASGETVFRETAARNDTTFDFINLDPRLYKIKLIRDRNGNGKWDTGNYLQHIQPEDVLFYPDDITVRANWDVEVNVKLPFAIKK